MMHRYATASGTHVVEIDDRALATMIAKCRAQSIETGGILIGRYSKDGATATVLEALGPPLGSRSGRTTFERGIQGLAELLEQRWSVDQYYLGEWHFHPEGPARPSGQDAKQMTEIGQDPAYECFMPILIVVGEQGGELCVQPWITIDGQPVKTSTASEG